MVAVQTVPVSSAASAVVHPPCTRRSPSPNPVTGSLKVNVTGNGPFTGPRPGSPITTDGRCHQSSRLARLRLPAKSWTTPAGTRSEAGSELSARTNWGPQPVNQGG